MACLRIFSSFVENPNDNNCFHLERRRCTGSSLDTNVNSDACNLRFRRVVGFSLHGWKMAARGPCAVGEGGGIRGEEDSEDDALKVTIEKSKKVLAMQKDLLQQIVERRNLVSSIKNDILNTKMDAISLSQNDGSLSNLDSILASGELDENFNNMVSDTDTLSTAVEMPETPPVDATNSFTDEENKHGTSEHFDRKQNSRILSDTYAQSTEVEVPETPPVGGNYDYVNEQKELRKGEISIADALGLLREASSEPAQSNIVLPLLPEASETYNTYDEKVDGLAGANVEGMTGEHDVVPDEGNTGSPLAGENVMNVILVAAECAPWSKTGGLGDVAGALPKALARRGHRVMVVVPRYGNYSEPQETGVRRRYKVDGQDMEVTYFHAYIDNVDFVFLDSPVFRHHDNNIYGGKREDILKRMVLFCKAAVEVPWYVPCGGSCYGDGNLVFIANDWHTALLPVYLKAYYRDNGLMTYTRSVLVIHNIAHQGRGPLDDFSFVALPGHYIDLFKLYDPLGGEHFNIFAAGLKTADRVVTVSQAYAWELKTAEGGWGLHGIINENDWKLQGIVNGVDTKDWNPKLDAHLKSDGYTNYSLETLHTGKPQCKAALQRELGLPVRDDVPLIGFIGRLDHQKGVDLIAEAIPWMLDHDVQLVMLGSGRQDLEDMLRRFESEHHDRVRGWVGFSVRLSHRITAGADALLMPSRFEPCGLNQLYAMIYGTVPIVHAVGGLRDTVHPFNPYQETGLGWTFDRAEANRLIDALGNCLNTYRNYKSSWEGLQRRGMMQDLSWDNAAQRYEEVLVAAKYQW